MKIIVIKYHKKIAGDRFNYLRFFCFPELLILNIDTIETVDGKP